MFDIIRNIIDHVWTTGSNDQQYIYYICGSVIVLSFIFIFDLLAQLVKSFRGKGDKR